MGSLGGLVVVVVAVCGELTRRAAGRYCFHSPCWATFHMRWMVFSNKLEINGIKYLIHAL